MIFHYLKIALRGIKFHPFFSMVSILGLSIGLASCLLIFSYWSHEKSYDTIFEDADRIFRVYQVSQLPNGELSPSASTISAVGERLSNEFSVAESVLRIHRAAQNTSIQYGETILSQDGMIGVEANFFEFFDFRFISGSQQTWMETPKAVILTEKVANKLFGDKDPLGKTLVINGVYGSYGAQGYEEFKDYTVAGVIADVPGNTHLDFSLLISLDVYADPEREFQNWGDAFYTYVKLSNPAQSQALGAALTDLGATTFSGQGVNLYPMALTDIHLRSNHLNEFKTNGNEQLLILLAALAVLVLVVAGCNYVNFSTARLLQRDKEISLRKVFWAGKKQLFNQLFLEAIFINVLALGLAILFILLINPYLETWTSIDLVDEMLGGLSLSLFAGIVGAAILISGVYPAWFVARTSMHNLGAKVKTQMRIQRPIVVFQFAISVFVIGFTLLVYSQLQFIKDRDTGFDLEKTLVITGPSVESQDFQMGNRLASFKNQWRQHVYVNGISSANFIPGRTIRGEAAGYIRKISDPAESAHTYAFSQIDGSFLKEFGIRMLAGRDFYDGKDESDFVIINQEAARFLGFESPEEAIGQRIFYRMQSQREIVGVISNFHQYSLRSAYEPIIFEKGRNPDSYVFIKYDSGNETELLDLLRADWKASFPGNPFDFFFLDEFYNRQYQQDMDFYAAFQVFSVLGILVASIGFFGLTYFLATSKVKEIGIRKTLGAGFADVASILGKGTIGSLLISGLVSIPAIFLIGEQWLENYTFRITIAWWILATPLVAFSILTLGLVFIQAIRSYRANPIIALNSEGKGNFGN